MPSPIGPKNWNFRSLFSHEPKIKGKKGHKKRPSGFFEGVKNFFFSGESSKKGGESLPRAEPLSSNGSSHHKTEAARSVLRDPSKPRYIDVGERRRTPTPKFRDIHNPPGDEEKLPVVIEYVDAGRVDLKSDDTFFSILEKVVSDRAGDEAEVKCREIREDLEGPYVPTIAHIPGKYFFQAEGFGMSEFLQRMEDLELNLNEGVDHIIARMHTPSERELAAVLVNKSRYEVVSNILNVPVHLIQVDGEGNPTGEEILINRHIQKDPIHIGFPLNLVRET